ncbi:unnamed protein product, partial [Urochloa humidicola]
MVQGLGLDPALVKVRVVRMVSTQVLEGVEVVVELANTVGLVTVEGLGQVRGQVHILKNRILVMENLPMLVVLVVVVVVDKLEVIGDLVHRDPVVALDLALAILTGIGMDLVMQVQMLMAMVVAPGAVKTVGVAVVQVLDQVMAMPTP